MFLCKTLLQEPSNDPGVMQGKERGLPDLSYVATTVLEVFPGDSMGLLLAVSTKLRPLVHQHVTHIHTST